MVTAQGPWGGGADRGPERLRGREDVMVFDAAMRRAGEQWWVEGGRAADAVVRSTTREDARARVYGALAELDGGGWRVRGDIAAVHGRVCTGSGPVSRTVLGGRVDGGA